jgi:LEA14-like dessication related protein
MTTQSLIENRLQRALKALELEQIIQRDWLEHGLDFVNLYVEDLEGNWLENWDEDEEENEIWNNGIEWLKGTFSEKWKPITSVFPANKIDLFNSLIADYLEEKSQKAIASKILKNQNQEIALVALLQLDNKDKFSLVFQLHPLTQNTLPENIKLSLLDEKGNLGQPSVISAIGDKYLQIKLFKATLGTRFKVEIKLGETANIESFIL